jgi:hypothetical protein
MNYLLPIDDRSRYSSIFWLWPLAKGGR